MDLVKLLDLNAGKFAGKDSLRFEGAGLTFAELRVRAEKAAGLLQSWGVEKGDKVAVMGCNTPSFVIAYYGALKAGAAVVPVNHKLAPPEVDYILQHSEAKVFLFDGDLAAVAGKIGTRVRTAVLGRETDGFTCFDRLAAEVPSFEPVEVTENDLAQILYTSGTTGKPKGCLHTRRNVVFAGITGALAVKMDEADRLLLAMPIWHSSPLNNWFTGAQFMGATTVLIREYHPLEFLKAIQAEKCTVYFGAPISYLLPLQMVPGFDQFDLSSMRCWIYGGGPVSGEVALLLMQKYKSNNFYQVYGMTEAGPTGTVLFPADQVTKAGSIGKTALPGAQVKVMRDETTPAGPGEAGEIWLQSECMMAGYYKDPAETARSFSGPWYKTGDVARLDEDGYLYIVDRLKDMIVTGGENVYSKEVEDALAAHPGVLESAVVGRPHPEWSETVVAFVVAKDPSLQESDLKDFLTPRLARYKIPREFVFADGLPHTPTGKIKKYELRGRLSS